MKPQADWMIWTNDPLHRPVTNSADIMRCIDTCAPNITTLWVDPQPQPKLLSEWVALFASRRYMTTLWRLSAVQTYRQLHRYTLPAPAWELYDAVLWAIRNQTLLCFPSSAQSPSGPRVPHAQKEGHLAMLNVLSSIGSAPQTDESVVKVNIPVISIALCAYNEAHQIGFAIRSVLAQDFSSWEIICVDDGSTDETANIVRSFTDFRIKLICLPENRGKAHALNACLDHARGELIFELDADDFLPPHAMSSLVAHAMTFSATTDLISGDYYLWTKTPNAVLHYRRLVQNHAIILNQFSAHPPIPRIYRMKLLQSLGGWPTNDLSGGRQFEDVALCSKILQKTTLSYLPIPLYHRVIRHNSISQTNRDTYRIWAVDWFTVSRETTSPIPTQPPTQIP